MPFDTRTLKEDEQYQRPNSMKGPLGLWVTAKDYHDLAMVKRTWRGRKASARRRVAGGSNVIRRRHMATGGRALVARLRMVAQGRRHPAVAGDSDDGTGRRGRSASSVPSPSATARSGSAPAAAYCSRRGGFDHNQAMRDEVSPRGRPSRTSACGARENTGDGIVAGHAPRRRGRPHGRRLVDAVGLAPDGRTYPARLGAVHPAVGHRLRPTASASPTSRRRT